MLTNYASARRSIADPASRWEGGGDVKELGMRVQKTRKGSKLRVCSQFFLLKICKTEPGIVLLHQAERHSLGVYM